MLIRVVVCLGLLVNALPALADTAAPVFGSSTQAPVIIVVNPETGLPMATAELPKPVIASAQ
jgi:hypothetical protein